MDAFVGKWEELEASNPKEVDQLLESRKDLDEEEKKRYRNSKSTFKVIKHAEKEYSITATSTAFPGKEQTQSFKLGDEFEGQALDDGAFKATITVENNSMIEVGSHAKWGDYKVTRRVNNDEMDSIVEISGKTIQNKMKRIQ